jgi:hypothetical protein
MYNSMGDKQNTKIVVTADLDDGTMYNPQTLSSIRPYIENYGLEIEFGKSKNKIHAVNRDMEKYKDWDILVVMSDDMKCNQSSYDFQIRQAFAQFFPDMDGIMHFNDGFQQDKLITLPVIGRKYYNRFGYVYHPSYKSLWCDNEQMEVARALEKIVYQEQVLFRHEHFSNVGGYMDEQLKYTESFNNQDHQNYLARKAKNFPKKV